MTRRWLSLGLLGGLSGLFASGCATTPAPYNPLNSGAVPTARKFSPNERGEKRSKLPAGVLASEAVMTSFDANEICFELVLRTTGERDDLAIPQSWRIIMEGSNPGFETPDFTPRAVRVLEAKRFAEKGNKLLGLAAQACQLAGGCTEDATNKAIWSGDKTVVLTGGGVVCFPNQNRVVSTTNYVRLRLSDQRNQSDDRTEHEFVWEFR